MVRSLPLDSAHLPFRRRTLEAELKKAGEAGAEAVAAPAEEQGSAQLLAQLASLTAEVEGLRAAAQSGTANRHTTPARAIRRVRGRRD